MGPGQGNLLTANGMAGTLVEIAPNTAAVPGLQVCARTGTEPAWWGQRLPLGCGCERHPPSRWEHHAHHRGGAGPAGTCGQGGYRWAARGFANSGTGGLGFTVLLKAQSKLAGGMWPESGSTCRQGGLSALVCRPCSQT